MAKKTVKIKLLRSPSGRLPKHRACLAGLGLRRVGSVSELEDTPAVRGMIDRVAYLLEVESNR
ncbi:MAG: 50S ribosomal protein L30 [Pseudomonadales bacterium]|nr:50S ribosomal protein L30 [Pseudomonadales bacterium]